MLKYRARLKSSVKKLAKLPGEGLLLRFFAEKKEWLGGGIGRRWGLKIPCQ